MFTEEFALPPKAMSTYIVLISPSPDFLPVGTKFEWDGNTLVSSGLMQFPKKTEFADPKGIDPDLTLESSPGELRINSFTIQI